MVKWPFKRCQNFKAILYCAMQLKHFAKRICLVSKYVLVFGMKNRAGMNDFRNQLESTYMWRLNAKMHANQPYTYKFKCFDIVIFSVFSGFSNDLSHKCKYQHCKRHYNWKCWKFNSEAINSFELFCICCFCDCILQTYGHTHIHWSQPREEA